MATYAIDASEANILSAAVGGVPDRVFFPITFGKEGQVTKSYQKAWAAAMRFCSNPSRANPVANIHRIGKEEKLIGAHPLVAHLHWDAAAGCVRFEENKHAR